MNVAWKLSALVLVLGLSACAKAPATGAGNETVAATPAEVTAAVPTPGMHADDEHAVDTGLPHVIAYRSPTCGCCELWVEHMRAAGFHVQVEESHDMGAVKAEAGVPVGKGSCHTAKVGDYYVEGHVPAEDIKRLLAEKPAARGLVVPGMVPGSPGMEQGGVSQPYDVLLLAQDGSTSVFAHHRD